MATKQIQLSPPSPMDLLAQLAKTSQDPAAQIQIAQQITMLATQQEQLKQAHERFEWEKTEREARTAFAHAFTDFKANAPKILKTKHVSFANKTGGNTDYWQVELDKAVELIGPAMLRHGLTYRWVSAELPGGMTKVTCLIRHRLGHEEEGATLAGPADNSGGKQPIQGIGSTSSYLQRYTLLMSCGITATGMDNDGQAVPSMEGLDEMLEKIRTAESKSALLTVYMPALEKAGKIGDKAATDKLSVAKNERLIALAKEKA